MTDTILRRKKKRMLPLSATVNCYASVIPDSITHPAYWEGSPTTGSPYAIGKIKVPDAESYLFVKGTTKERRALYLLCFDKKNHFAAAKLILYSNDETGCQAARYGMDNNTHYTPAPAQDRRREIIYPQRCLYVYRKRSGFRHILTRIQ